jgi:excisionase family DNA binding protein
MSASRKPYTVKELAERWQVSQEAVYALIRKHARGEPGGLPAFTIGGKLWRIRAEEVERWEGDGGSMQSGNTGSERSTTPGSGSTKPSSSGGTSTDPTDDVLVSSLKERADSRLMGSLAASKV